MDNVLARIHRDAVLVQVEVAVGYFESVYVIRISRHNYESNSVCGLVLDGSETAWSDIHELRMRGRQVCSPSMQ